MARLVFDIETSALPLESFDESQQEYLFRELERLPEESERETRRAEIHRMFNLWPFTAQVVCIGMLNAESPARPGRSSSFPARMNSSCSPRSGTWRNITIRW
jgi:hypothetical protein